VLGDQVLDGGDEHGLPFAAAGAHVPAEADEVGIGLAVPVAGMVDRHALSAAAVQGAFQIVLVSLGAISGDIVGVEDVLHLGPHGRVHEPVVDAEVACAFVDDVALVVRIAQHPLQRGDPDQFGGPLRGRQAGQPAGGELVGQVGQGAVAGRVCLERPRDQRRTLGVDRDGADLAALRVAFSDIEVAERCLGDGAAGRRLLLESFGDLACEVAGVELRDGGHDAVQQHPCRGLIDVLGDRHQGHPGLAEGKVDRDVVGAVAGEPVELVDDAQIDPVALDVGEHALQVGTPGVGGGLPGVDELLHDHRAGLGGGTSDRVALGGDGEALLEPAAFGLFLGGDPDVRDGALSVVQPLLVVGYGGVSFGGGGHGARSSQAAACPSRCAASAS
jgi:hypothetical protein